MVHARSAARPHTKHETSGDRRKRTRSGRVVGRRGHRTQSAKREGRSRDGQQRWVGEGGGHAGHDQTCIERRKAHPSTLRRESRRSASGSKVTWAAGPVAGARGGVGGVWRGRPTCRLVARAASVTACPPVHGLQRGNAPPPATPSRGAEFLRERDESRLVWRDEPVTHRKVDHHQRRVWLPQGKAVPDRV